jgi:hypothetical protein
MHDVTQMSRVAFVAAFSLLFALVLSPGTTVAQDDTPHPAHVHSGTCDALGDVVAPLADVSCDPVMAIGGNATEGNASLGNITDGNATNATGGNATGPGSPIPAEVSLTAVPLSLDEMLASPHAINVHLSADEIGTYIACGDIGGPTLPDGSLAIGLHELDGSGFFGIAYLEPSESPADGTDITVFLAQNLIGTDGTAGNATGGIGAGGNTTDGSATEGNTSDGNGTGGNVTEGDDTDGNGTDGNATDGNATGGNATDGNTSNGTDGNVTDGNGTGDGGGNGTGGDDDDGGNGSGGNGSGDDGSGDNGSGGDDDGNSSGGNGS